MRFHCWSCLVFYRGKDSPAELIEGIPQIFLTLGRMLPPDFHKITDAKNYYLPPGLSVTELILPLPLGADREARAAALVGQHFPSDGHRRHARDGADGLAGTFVALIVAFPLGFSCSAQHDTHPWVYFSVRSVLNLVRTIPDLALGLPVCRRRRLGRFRWNSGVGHSYRDRTR